MSHHICQTASHISLCEIAYPNAAVTADPFLFKYIYTLPSYLIFHSYRPHSSLMSLPAFVDTATTESVVAVSPPVAENTEPVQSSQVNPKVEAEGLSDFEIIDGGQGKPSIVPDLFII